jgi:hypothetical protein
MTKTEARNELMRRARANMTCSLEYREQAVSLFRVDPVRYETVLNLSNDFRHTANAFVRAARVVNRISA